MADFHAAPSNSPGLLGWLGIVFIILKLTGVIDWSWWLVTLPLWGGMVLFLTIAGVVVLIGGTFYFRRNR